jgi:hypothetical protein
MNFLTVKGRSPFKPGMTANPVRMLILFVVTCIFAVPVFAAEKPVWVEATGEAYLGDLETPKEVKERAKRDAAAKAVEKAVGIFIKSQTLVSNYQLAEDLIYASVRGKITKLNVLHEGWDRGERNLWTVKVRALVELVYPERGDSLQIKLSLSKSDLKEGEEVRVFYQANRNCYVYIFSIAADGSVTLLLPNSLIRENLVTPEKVHEFPPSGNEIKLKAMFLPDFKEKTAEEKIKVIATSKPENLIPSGFQEGVFKVYDARSTGMISDLVKRLNQIDPSEWTEATAVYTISR